MALHLNKTLLRQLKRLELNDESFAADSGKWEEFLQKISKTYTEADQERYLLERSMELSSNEMLALNRQLETAQHIARLGYWNYNRPKDQILLSKELYNILHLNQNEPVPKFKEFMNWVHEEERPHISKLIENAFSKGVDYEYELRMKLSTGEYRWYYVVGRPTSHHQPITSLSGIMMDITTRKKAAEEVTLLNQQLLSVARQIGKADIAASTLHNVGNVLNSASVSIDMLHEKIEFSYGKEIVSVLNLLKDHESNLPDYLTQDPKGKLIPHYLAELADPLENSTTGIITEIAEIKKQLQHIKDIVATQMDIGRSAGLVEKIALSSLIDSAIQISDNSRQFKGIAIHKKYEKIPPLSADKTKLLQILVNVVQNAKESVLANENAKEKEIHISMTSDPIQKAVLLSIKDNGVGILSENLIKIFSFGFSTKENGHGYGLHSSGLAAQEMGGKLEAQSEGIGKGAVFNLTLPLMAANK